MGKITATDIDPSGGGGVSYSFISDWGVDTFSLDPITGVITVSAVDGLGERTTRLIFWAVSEKTSRLLSNSIFRHITHIENWRFALE